MKRIPLSRDYQPRVATSYLIGCPPVSSLEIRSDVQDWCKENLLDDWTVWHDLQSEKTYIEFADDADAALFKLRWM